MWISTVDWAEQYFYYDRTSTVQGRFRIAHAGECNRGQTLPNMYTVWLTPFLSHDRNRLRDPKRACALARVQRAILALGW